MISASAVSLAGLSSPLIGIVYVFVFLGERLIASQIIGGIVIMIGLFVLEFHFRKIYTPHKHKHHLKFAHWHHF